MEPTLPTAVLRTVRENSGLNQAALASRLAMSASVLSRLEKADTTESAVAWRYLDAVSTEESAAVRDFYMIDWRISERPSFHHPDRLTLPEIERALQELETFEHNPAFDPILARPVH